MKIATFSLLALALAATPVAAQEILAPSDQGVVLGSTLEVEVANASSAPSIIIDGAPVTTAWAALPYTDHWFATFPLASAGQHTIQVSVAGGSPQTARFENVTGAGQSVAVGDRVVRHFLSGHPTSEMKWSWGPAVFLYGLDKYSRATSQSFVDVAALYNYYRSREAQGIPTVDRPDVCAPALGALALVRNQGNQVGIHGAKLVASYLDNEQRNSLGAIDHLGSNSPEKILCDLSYFLRPWAHSIWLDSLMMYGVFSVQWGSSQGDTALRDFGAAQPGIFASKLQDPQTGLFTHAYDDQQNQPFGARWLRGNGWVAVTIVEMLDELPASHPNVPELQRILAAQAQGILNVQMANGLWDSLADTPGATYSESSGSALVAYGLAKGARLGILPPSARAKAKRAFQALTARLARRPDGDLSVTGSSTATNATPVWIYKLIPQADDVDYGVGAYLLLAAELKNESW
jgi:rhamnogalacturonyl hydrolase YesR